MPSGSQGQPLFIWGCRHAEATQAMRKSPSRNGFSFLVLIAATLAASAASAQGGSPPQASNTSNDSFKESKRLLEKVVYSLPKHRIDLYCGCRYSEKTTSGIQFLRLCARAEQLPCAPYRVGTRCCRRSLWAIVQRMARWCPCMLESKREAF